MSTPLFETATPSAEFYFDHESKQYTVFPAGWVENGCDVFEIVLSETDEFVDTIFVSPLEDVSDAFDRWKASKR